MYLQDALEYDKDEKQNTHIAPTWQNDNKEIKTRGNKTDCHKMRHLFKVVRRYPHHHLLAHLFRSFRVFAVHLIYRNYLHWLDAGSSKR